ncbi:unnamed protein product [Aphanomyces euteiches]|uniref:Uncharacterized protein n=1 Tax=Aphanomyces euteiches TaxID=100861 RepID=A0A6G0WQW1_9STRA|nr:hypothetical protein Ae201684_012698 [Aphanomyces euteiches]KAH9095614.1 hypothetical protein Ae201684P_015415 [Aphanomyces euteiches]KAH9150265.1 hypothetical protein AeRB84_006861 [Aphanomyces euteiches]
MKYFALVLVLLAPIQGCVRHLLDCMETCGASKKIQAEACVKSIDCYDNCYSNMTIKFNSGRCSRFDPGYPTLEPETEAPTTAVPATTARRTTGKPTTLPPSTTVSQRPINTTTVKPVTTRAPSN